MFDAEGQPHCRLQPQRRSAVVRPPDGEEDPAQFWLICSRRKASPRLMDYLPDRSKKGGPSLARCRGREVLAPVPAAARSGVE